MYTSFQKSRVNNLFSNSALNWSKLTVKQIYIVVSILNVGFFTKRIKQFKLCHHSNKLHFKIYEKKLSF